MARALRRAEWQAVLPLTGARAATARHEGRVKWSKQVRSGANMGFIGAIVAVATIGGFLFGYDSGAVNGTQDGLKQTFGLVDGSWSPANGLGFTVASLLIGCFIGAFFAGRLADVIGRRNMMMIAALLFLAGALVQGIAQSHLIFLIARILRRNGGRRRERAFARLHLGSRAGEYPRPADDRAANHDHHRPDRGIPGQLFPRPRRRRFDRDVLAAGWKRGGGCT